MTNEVSDGFVLEKISKKIFKNFLNKNRKNGNGISMIIFYGGLKNEKVINVVE